MAHSPVFPERGMTSLMANPLVFEQSSFVFSAQAVCPRIETLESTPWETTPVTVIVAASAESSRLVVRMILKLEGDLLLD